MAPRPLTCPTLRPPPTCVCVCSCIMLRHAPTLLLLALLGAATLTAARGPLAAGLLTGVSIGGTVDAQKCPKPDCFCPMVASPVCGKDGKT